MLELRLCCRLLQMIAFLEQPAQARAMAPQALEPPKAYLCPIPLGLMRDPVIASDDHTCASSPALDGSAVGGLAQLCDL